MDLCDMFLFIVATIPVCVNSVLSRDAISIHGKSLRLSEKILFTGTYLALLLLILIPSRTYFKNYLYYEHRSFVFLVPGFAEIAIFLVVPCLYVWNMTTYGDKIDQDSPLYYSLVSEWLEYDVITVGAYSLRSGLCIMALNCTLLFSSLLSVASFQNDKLVVRPWPYGLFVKYSVDYTSLTNVVEEYIQYGGEFSGPPVLVFNFTLYSNKRFIWSTRWAADGSNESDRLLAVQLIKEKCPHLNVSRYMSDTNVI